MRHVPILFLCVASIVAAAPLQDMKLETLVQRSPVTWQSAFWSLIPLALNTMTQPAGMVCFLPSSFGPVLRCTPVICFIDTLMILEQLTWLTITTWSPFKAASQFAQFRFQDTESPAAEDSLAGLKKNTSFRIVIFIFGALPQMIKLYSMEGLRWTQVVGVAYMISFAVMELFNILAWKSGRIGYSQLPRSPTVAEISIGFTSVVLSVLFAFYLFAVGLISACRLYIGYLRWWHAVLPIFLVPVWLVSSLTEPQSALFLSILASVSLVSASALAVSASAGIGGVFFLLIPRHTSTIIAAILSAHLALLIVGLAMYNLYKSARVRRLKFLNSASLWLFIILYVDASLLYYAFGYTSQGTSKPAWSELLG